MADYDLHPNLSMKQKQQLGKDFPAYLEGSAIKYIHRHKYKDANIQDLEKAVWYINKLIEHYENL